MHLNEDNKRLLYGILVTLIVHIALFVALGFVDFTSATPIRPISISLSELPESLIELPDPPDSDETPDEVPDEPEPVPDDPILAEELDTELQQTEDLPPVAETQPQPEPATDPAEAEAPAVAQTPSPAPAPAPRPQERQPDASEFVDTLAPTDTADREDLRRRDATPTSPAADDDGTFAAVQEAQRQAALEFIRALDEQERVIADELRRRESERDAGQVSQADDGQIIDIRSRVGDIVGRSGSDAAGETDDPGGTGDRDRAEDVGTGDDIEWADGRLRSRVSGSELAFTANDLTIGRGTVYIEVSFAVDERGIVQPGSVRIDRGAPVLSSEAQVRLRQTIQTWRFTENPGAPSVRGTIRLELRRI
ncbi:MAG: hypothetical protein EA383_08900 [Spirochaetaceae bacterium]|nr:MAG: hypothetical protein EA383_08900 [Spirochaetaceae bacterium]